MIGFNIEIEGDLMTSTRAVNGSSLCWCAEACAGLPLSSFPTKPLQAFSMHGTKPGWQCSDHLDRKIAVLRDTLHKLTSQLDEEGLELPLVRILSDATYALNSLTSVNGCSPYTAVLGRMPSLLPQEDAVLSDNVPDMCSPFLYPPSRPRPFLRAHPSTP